MPYRRLPNTDQARLHALQQAVRCASEAEYNNQVLRYATMGSAQRMLMQFETQVTQYKDNFKSKVSANKQYRHMVQNARMYISHFIQVLNLAAIRGEIKPEQIELYGLDPQSLTVPDLSSEADILEWGQKIIDGERQRVSMGGFAIYNPPINKVQVYYDIFKEHQVNHTLHKQTTTRVQGDMETIRREADQLILQIWNEVEEHYRDLPPYERLCRCQAYGLIYYYRRGEKKLSPETDEELKRQQTAQQEAQRREQTIQWS